MCARGERNAARANIPVPPRSGRTGHSRRSQQESAVESKGCQWGVWRLLPTVALCSKMQRSSSVRKGIPLWKLQQYDWILARTSSKLTVSPPTAQCTSMGIDSHYGEFHHFSISVFETDAFRPMATIPNLPGTALSSIVL